MKAGKPERYLALAEEIRRLIRERGLGQGERLPSERELSELLGANHLTVRKALKVLREQDLIYNVPSRGTFVGRRPPDHRSSRLVGVLFPDPEVFFFELLTLLEAKLDAFDLHPVVHLTQGSPEREEHTLDLLEKIGVAGIVAAPNVACRARYGRVRCPAVFFDSLIDGLDIPYVVTDDFRGAVDATRHLLELGHERLAYVGGSDSGSEPRLAGFLDTLRRHGLSAEAAYIKRRDHTRQWGYNAAEEFLRLSTPPTAIFCGSDTIAAGTLQCLRDRRIACPGQVSIVGFGNTLAAQYLELTTVSQPCPQIAEAVWTALRNLLERRPAERATKIGTELIVRKSTARTVARVRAAVRRRARRP